MRIPFVGSLVNRNVNPSSFSGKDQLFTNCYPEVVKNPITGNARIFLNKRPGCSGTAVASVVGGSFGSCVWTSNSASSSPTVFSFTANGNLIKVFTQAAVQVGGNIANAIGCLFLTDTVISSTGNLTAIIVDSATNALEAWFFPEGGAWTQISDGDFPANLGTPEPITQYIAHMDGFMFVMSTNGKIWNSDLNSLANWTANAFITAQSMPDGGVGLARYKNLIVAFGRYTTEFFQNAGNATGSPLIGIPGSTLRIGAVQNALSARCILPVANTVYWIGVSSESGQKAVYRLNGFQAEKVSTPYIDKLLAENNIYGFAGAFTSHGLSHVVMYGASVATPVYCIDTDTWWQINTGSVVMGSVVGSINSGSSASYFVDTQDLSTKIFTISTALYQDDAAAYTMTVRTENQDFGADDYKFCSKLRVIGDRQSSASTLTISYSDDDFANFTTAGTVDLSTANHEIYRLGRFKRRAWRFEHAANTPCRLEAYDLEVDKGQH